MKRYHLIATKTKMIKLLRGFGYQPSKTAQFTKAFRRRTWWLEWFDDTGSYKATLSTAAGRAFLGVRFWDSLSTPEQWISHTLDGTVLDKYNLREEIDNEQKTDHRS